MREGKRREDEREPREEEATGRIKVHEIILNDKMAVKIAKGCNIDRKRESIESEERKKGRTREERKKYRQRKNRERRAKGE